MVTKPMTYGITSYPRADDILAWRKMSTTESKLEKEARASAIVLAPTVLAEGARAGELFVASALWLPAATWRI